MVTAAGLVQKVPFRDPDFAAICASDFGGRGVVYRLQAFDFRLKIGKLPRHCSDSTNPHNPNLAGTKGLSCRPKGAEPKAIGSAIDSSLRLKTSSIPDD